MLTAKKVQVYLEHHHIGSLFEDLMAKIIKEMPDQPIPFLIRLLKKIHPEDNIPHSLPPSGSKSRSPMSSSMGLTGKPIARQSLDDSKDFRRSALAKSWGGPDNHDRPGSATKSREYERPWLHGSKKGKGEQAQSNKENTRHGMKVPKTEEKDGSWNADTKVAYNDFDEWFGAQNKGSKNAVTEVQDIETKQSWHDQQDFDPSMDKRGIGYPLQVNDKSSQPIVILDDDLEGEEIKLRKDVKTEGETSEGNSVASYGSGRSSKKNARLAAQEHRRHLQSLLYHSGENSTCESSQHRKLSDEDIMDDATELLENSNELENEGVTNATSKGFKLSKALKSGTTDNESVKVSICARCARIISGLPNDQRSDVESNISNRSDEDFESVSQTGSLTGEPARITWPSGFDSGSEALAPKKGKPLWEKPDPKPQKGKHMYRNSSTFLTDLAASPRPPSAASDRSDDMFAPRPGKGWQRKHQDSSDNDTDSVNNDRSSPSLPSGRPDRSSPSLASGRPWARPLDTASEAGSEDWAQDRNKKVSFKSKSYARRGYLDDDSDR